MYYIYNYNNNMYFTTNIFTGVSHIVIINVPTEQNLRCKCYWKTLIVVIIERNNCRHCSSYNYNYHSNVIIIIRNS